MNKVNKQKPILDVCRLNKVGLGGFLETKIRGIKLTEVMNTMFYGWEYYSSNLVEGRILVIWNANLVKLQVLQESDQLLHCQVRIHNQKVFCITFVYGSNNLEMRRYLWMDLEYLSKPSNAWMVLGDFNASFNPNDRMGGRPITVKEMEDARHWFDLGLVEEMKTMGPYFTWSNNQEGGDRIFSKLDRVFANEAWLDEHPLASAGVQWEVGSDHSMIVIKQLPEIKVEVRPFRFYNMWIVHPQFREVVLKNWNQPLRFPGRGLNQISWNLLRLKHTLKSFNWKIMGDVVFNYERSKLDYQQAHSICLADPSNREFSNNDRVACLEFKRHEKLYASYISKKSKIDWLSAASGNIDFQAIGQGSVLSSEDQLGLIKPFTVKEVKLAMFSIHSLKSPGSDGFGAGFFKALWKDIGKDISWAVMDFFESARIPLSLNSTLLTLIPKVDHPTNASEFRPIACFNTLYKCISKMLCNRLNLVLPALISQNQGAFIKNRFLAHNILILQDLLKGYNRRTVSPCCIMKIDISKAYDSIDWNFLENLLNALCFPKRFIKWIMVCLRGSSYALVLNGSIQGRFQGARGLKQGDPISPLLFVIVMDYLTRLLLKTSREKEFKFHPLCKSLNLVSLCFADDLLLFCKANQSSVRLIQQAFSVFTNTSGLSINDSKSRIYIGGLDAGEKDSLLQDCCLQEGQFPLRYLGIPLRPTKWRACDYVILIDKMRARLKGWSSRHLSYAGRVQLINSVLLGIRSYWMNIFILPQKVVKAIDSLCLRFLWGEKDNRSKMHRISWEHVCRPKCYGGLGFKDSALWNKVMMAKLMQDTSWYWRRIIKLSNIWSDAVTKAVARNGKIHMSTLNLLVFPGELESAPCCQDMAESLRSSGVPYLAEQESMLAKSVLFASVPDRSLD
ncbi:uncharacterized protein LOC133815556 [Humulus lupulus]|uniref:uncharacterized protein LOC133815556 n=1 Tax=Humulus lupulus TaxID=3486 RepID=UPI002B412FDE|nr:uncharacterized protein LOC133815556 [Humulus lupulus]